MSITPINIHHLQRPAVTGLQLTPTSWSGRKVSHRLEKNILQEKGEHTEEVLLAANGGRSAGKGYPSTIILQRKSQENEPVSARAKANGGDRVAVSTDLSSDGPDDGTDKASKDIVRPSG